jgi:ABC-type phosphate/phosphonate transport system substrate-binding protein
MRNSVKLLACVLAFSGMMTGCNKTQTIRLQLTPSKAGMDLTANAKALKPVLEKYAPGYTFTISTGTSFASDGLALAAGSIDASFITASVFAQSEISNAGKVDMLLRASRNGFKVIDETPDSKGNKTSAEARAAQLVKMNDLSYGYHGQAAGVASYYYAECIMKRDNLTAFDTDKDGKVELYELAGKKVGMMGTSSPAGYTYPLYAFYNEKGKDSSWTNGMTKVANNADATKGEFNMVTMSSYSAGFDQLMNGTIDAMWGYMDVRNDAYGKWDNWKGKDEAFTGTYTVALTQGILNDGVAVRSGLSTGARTAIATAFKKMAATGSVNDDGTKKGNDSDTVYDIDGDGQASPAYIVFSLYSHTGYVDAANSDYDDEVAFQKWAVTNLK